MNGDRLVCGECGFETEATTDALDDLKIIQDEDSDEFGKIVCPECESADWDRTDTPESVGNDEPEATA